MPSQTKPPIWYWVVAAIALLWNAMGTMAYLTRVYMTEENRAALSEDMQTYLDNLPVWYTAVFAFAVFGGSLGSIALLMRQGLAYVLFIISFVAVLLQASYDLFLVENRPSYDTSDIFMIIMIPLVGAGLLYLTQLAKSKGWIS